MKRPSGF